jgi:hypothetical protein
MRVRWTGLPAFVAAIVGGDAIIDLARLENR